MNRAEQAQALVQALALIGQPRQICEVCGQPDGAKTYGGSLHTPRSAALAKGLDPQVVYRAVKKISEVPNQPPGVSG